MPCPKRLMGELILVYGSRRAHNYGRGMSADSTSKNPGEHIFNDKHIQREKTGIGVRR